MENKIDNLIEKAYKAFNSQDIPTALSTFHKDVEWPKAFEGGYVKGHNEISEYWTRQWTQINGKVEPIKIIKRENKTYEVTVHQLIKDLEGKILIDANGNIEHAATRLVHTANEYGGKDNISVVIAMVNKPFVSEGGWVKSLFGKTKKPKIHDSKFDSTQFE